MLTFFCCTVRQMSGGSSALDNINRIRKLEKDLELKAQQAARYEAQISELKLGKMKMGATMAKPAGPVLSRTGSVERSLEDQILKDLQVRKLAVDLAFFAFLISITVNRIRWSERTT